MTFGNEFPAKELLALVSALDGQEHSGTTLLGLANEADLPLGTVRELVSKYTEYFVSVGGEPVYALNRFGPFSGSAGAITEDIKKRAETLKKRMGWFLWAFQHFSRGG